ncbi:MAG: hypothetical protein R3264_03755, partial [Anaerolineae bacterium]|nr:hypothetical protein [Anaerolineae bacterium]
GLIVASKFEAGATWRPQTLSPSRAMLALLDNTICARSNPGFAIPILGRVAGQALALTGKRGEADTVAPALLDLLDSRP